MADALCRRHALLAMLETKLFGLESLKDIYEHDVDFAEIFAACEKFFENGYYRHNGFLFKANKLYVPKCSNRELLVSESHEGGFDGSLWGSKDPRNSARAFLLASYEA